MPTPSRFNPKPFKDRFRKDVADRKDRRYCFILGAGASVSSGIPSGKELAERWLRELHDQQCSTGMPLAEWCKSPECPVPGIDHHNPGVHYPELYKALFPNGDPAGQLCIQESIRGGQEGHPNIPSIGYAYLALLLRKIACRIVITTNFDNLAADALLLFTGSLPRIVGHERVASFASLQDGQPLIAKIHGDVGFVTANTPEGVSKLPKEWCGPLHEILRNCTPIVIGYDGNDGSLMNFLCNEMLETGTGKSLFSSGIFWCYRAGEGKDWKTRIKENPRLKSLTEKHLVRFVPIGDFDLWMMELGEACEVGDPEAIFRENAERRRKTLAEQLAKARTAQATPAPDPAVEESRQETREEIGRRVAGWHWMYMAKAEKNLGIAEMMHEKSVELAPKDLVILGEYAIFLHTRIKSYAKAKRFYEKTLNLDPTNADTLGNYACFLTRISKEHRRAEELFKRALELNPKHANNLGLYAIFLREVHRDQDRAQEYFERALKADPNHASNLSNYALFLTEVRQDQDRAQQYFERALRVDPNNPVIHGNFANFAKNVLRDSERARRHYEHALKADQENSNTLGNFGGFLLANGERERGSSLLELAAAGLNEESPKGLDVEVWFYSFAHQPAPKRPDALANLKKALVKDGSRSPGWDFGPNIARAIKDEHPDAVWLPKLADVINGKSEPSVLADWPAWQNA